MASKSYPSSLLQKYIRNEELLKFFRKFNNGEENNNLNGYLLSEKENFLLIRSEADFTLGGYVIITKDLLGSIRCNKFDKAQKRINKKEGVSKEILSIPLVSLDSWQAIFKQMKERDYHVIIKCENQEESDFFIGPVKKVNKSSVSVQFYDPAGQLCNDLDNIKYKNITWLEFLDRYTVVFRKYLKPA